MARTPRNAVSRARRGVSLRGERRIIRSPVNGPAAASIARNQHNGTHPGAPSEFTESSIVPSFGVEVQPEVQTGCLADGLDVHQPICMGLQQSRTDLDVLTLGDLDIGVASLQTDFSLEFGNQSSESICASPFQSYGSLASALSCASPFQSYGSLASALSCGAGNPTSNALTAAPPASDYGFRAALSLGPEVFSPLSEIFLPRKEAQQLHMLDQLFPPEHDQNLENAYSLSRPPKHLGPEVFSPLSEILLPLKEAEQLHMLDQLFPPEHDQNLENAYSLSPPKQLYQPKNLEGSMQMVNYDPPSHLHTSRSLLPLGEMIHYSAAHPQSFSFGHWHQQSPQQLLTDLHGDMQKQLLGSAPLHSSPSNDLCAMEYPARYPPSPNSNVITAIVPNIVEAAPTLNITPFDSLAQPLAASALPNSVLIPNGSGHSASANHSNVAARIVTAGRGRVPRNRLPRSRQATVGRLRQIRPAPTTNASPETKNLAEVMLSRIETQRQNHIKSERKKRKLMNEMYATIRSLLPPVARKIRPDNATVVMDMINYVERCENELKMLEQQLKHSRQLVAALCNVNPSIHHSDTAAARFLTTKGFTCVDHTHDASALTAVATSPEIGSDSGLASFWGTNVAINYCQDNYSLTVSSPYLGQAVALLEPMLIAIQDHHLEVVFASIITTANTHIYSLQCKASSHAELLRNNLHSALQGIVNDFPSSSSSQEHRG